MTNAIETTKREMWKAIAKVKGRIEINYSVKDMIRDVEQFEGLLEDHLEQLRQQYEQMAATARDRFEAIQSLEQANQELQRCNDNQCESIRVGQSRLEEMTEELDAIRNKLQAFEFANKSSGEFLIDALRKVKSQRKTIKDLRKAQGARESVGATLRQAEDETPRCSLCGGSGFVFTGHAAMTGNPIEKICVCKKTSASHD